MIIIEKTGKSIPPYPNAQVNIKMTFCLLRRKHGSDAGGGAIAQCIIAKAGQRLDSKDTCPTIFIYAKGPFGDRNA